MAISVKSGSLLVEEGSGAGATKVEATCRYNCPKLMSYISRSNIGSKRSSMSLREWTMLLALGTLLKDEATRAFEAARVSLSIFGSSVKVNEATVWVATSST